MSMKRLVFVLGLFMLLVSSTVVQGRALRSTTGNADVGVVSGCQQQGGGGGGGDHHHHHQQVAAVSTFAVAANNNSSNDDRSSSLRSLAFKLASGPSKKGPGH